uniref:Xylulose kinase-1 n=1 Tax=Tanacetum cinerariifolium TaxID=118510 RepID=A0A6L2KIJ5_TANCI|nr:xylulose kinase-1 [Tanacetum cinerariifolium]
MADLKFVDQHNMVACLEKTGENAEFHQIMDFLSTCSINYALTVSPTIYASYIEQFWNTAISKIVNSVKQIHAIVDGKAVVISESSVRSDLLFNDEDDEAIHQEGVNDSVERAITTDASLAPRNHIGGTDAQTRFETASKRSSDPPLSTGHTVRSGKDRMEQETDLTDFVPPTPHDLPLSRGHTPGSDEGVRRLEKKRKARTSQPMKKRLFKGRVEISTDKSLDKGSGEKGGSTVDQVSTARPEIRSEKAKEKGVAFRDMEEPPRLTKSTTTLQPLPTIDPKDKGKGVLVEEEPEKLHKVKRRDQRLAQIESDADLAQKIYKEELAKFDIAQKERQKQEEATIAALTEEFDEI